MAASGGGPAAERGARARRWRLRLLAVALGLVAGALAGEIALRVLTAARRWDEAGRLAHWVDQRRHPPPVLGPCKAQAGQARLGDLLVPLTGSEALYRLAPELDTCFEGARLTTDARGLRVLPAAAPPRAAERSRRILWIGDSRAFGWGLEAEDSPSVLLENALAARAGLPVEVLNGAVPGYNATQEAALAAELAPRLEPDCILVAFSANDLALPVVLPRPAAPGLGGSLLWRELRRRWGPRRWLRYADEALIDQVSDEELPRVPRAFRDTVGRAGYMRALASLARTADALGVPVAIVATYRRAPLDRAAVLEGLRRLGLAHLDLDWPEGEGWRLSAADPHPNRAANERYVARLADALEESGVCEPSATVVR